MRIYKLRRLEEAELAILRRRGKSSCRRPCNAPVAFRVVSLARPRGRVAGGSRMWLLCEDHAKKFAATHPDPAFPEVKSTARPAAGARTWLSPAALFEPN